MTIQVHRDTPAPAPTGGARAAACTATAAALVNATKLYGKGPTEVRALDGVTLEFARGQFSAIMGPSGSGKSTLMHCIAGLDTLTSGQALIGDAELTGLDDRRLTVLRRDRIGFVFQAFNLVPTLTALENIILPTALARRRPDREWLGTVIETVGLGDRLAHRPSELSGGQQQRVAVARALATRPEIVFADEPTGNLDSNASAEILGFMHRAMRDLGQTVVLVTHDPVAASFASRVVFLARSTRSTPSPSWREGRPAPTTRLSSTGPAPSRPASQSATPPPSWCRPAPSGFGSPASPGSAGPTTPAAPLSSCSPKRRRSA